MLSCRRRRQRIKAAQAGSVRLGGGRSGSWNQPRTPELLREEEAQGELAPRCRRGQGPQAESKDPPGQEAPVAGVTSDAVAFGENGPERLNRCLKRREKGCSADVVESPVEGLGESVSPAKQMGQ